MKTLILSILLIVPMSAQDQKAISGSPTCSAETLSECTASGSKTVQVGLTPAENEQLALLLMQAQAARIDLLEALKAKRASNDEVEALEEATKAYSTLLQSLAKSHAACAGGAWNFATKSWMCQK